ncbi:MAG: hypothetical protein KDK07_20350 [Bauldia sp.]|nr:hypothetical protein [Bauldia sp.]
MLKKAKLGSFAVAILLTSLSGLAVADPSAEKYLDDAAPVLHHSCRSVVEEAAGDSYYIEGVVRLLVAVSLYNREIDVSTFATTAAEKSALHEKFVEAVAAGCQDKDALLAGVVDDAVVNAFSLDK